MTRDNPGEATERLLDSHRQRGAALLDADAAALAPLLDERLVFVHANGRVESKAELLAALAEGRLRYDSLMFTESRVVVADDLGIVQGTMEAQVMSGGERKSLSTLFCSTWIEAQGRWMLLAYSATRN